MSGTGDIELVVQTEDGPARALIARSALVKLSGRSHITPEEIASAHRMEIEDMVRDKLRGGRWQEVVRIGDKDF